MPKGVYIKTEEHKRKISEAHKSLVNLHWAKRPEVRLKMSEIRLDKPNRYWLGKKRPDISNNNHYLWNGMTPLSEQIRKCVEYYKWRSDVFERDHYTCQECQEVGGYLHADHIKQFSFILKEHNIKSMEDALKCKELWDRDNGRTLCKECHRKIPAYSYDGKRKMVFIKGEY